MMMQNVNPTDMKVFLNHVYEFKKGVRQMVLYTMNRKNQEFAVNRLKKQRIKFVIQLTMNASTCSSARTNVSMPYG